MLEQMWWRGLSPPQPSPDKMTIPKIFIHTLVWKTPFDNMSCGKNGCVDNFFYWFLRIIFMGMSAKDRFTYRINKINGGVVSVDVRFMGEVVITLYLERPKSMWFRKPIMPRTWLVVDSKVHDSFMYIEGMCTPKDIQAWCVEEVTNYLSLVSKEVVPDTKDDITYE